ncbi:MAG: hypothetical protein EZS28_046338, partial [Streblomastix strix]
MEGEDFGVHCALPSCNTLDFLPIICSSCGKAFCKLHNLPHMHNCEMHQFVSNDRVSIQCPICQKIVYVGSQSKSNEI